MNDVLLDFDMKRCSRHVGVSGVCACERGECGIVENAFVA